MNLKVCKMQDVGTRCLDNIDEIKDSFEKVGTIVTCMLEFNSIE